MFNAQYAGVALLWSAQPTSQGCCEANTLSGWWGKPCLELQTSWSHKLLEGKIVSLPLAELAQQGPRQQILPPLYTDTPSDLSMASLPGPPFTCILLVARCTHTRTVSLLPGLFV